MSEYSKTARGKITANSSDLFIPLPFIPDYVKILNYTGYVRSQTNAPYGVSYYWHKQFPLGSFLERYTAPGGNLIKSQENINSFYIIEEGLSLQYGPIIQVSAITKASPAVVTANSHGFSTGDYVSFQDLYQTSNTGMPQICGMPFQVTVTDANTFTIPWNTNQSNYTALSTPLSGTVSRVLYPNGFMPGVSFISNITNGSTTLVSCTAPHNLSLGSVVKFRIPEKWSAYEFNDVTGVVQSIPSLTSFVVNIDSLIFSTFNSNILVSNTIGLSFPQVVCVGDINTGNNPYAVGNAYPGPLFNGAPTLNGPSIEGSFKNTLTQGMVIRNTSFLSGDVLYWEAVLHDFEVLE